MLAACGGAAPPTGPIIGGAPAPPDDMACRFTAPEGALPPTLALRTSATAAAPFGYLVHAPAAELALAPTALAQVQVDVRDAAAQLTALATTADALALAAPLQVRPGLRAGDAATWRVQRADAGQLTLAVTLPDLLDVDGADADHAVAVDIACDGLRPGPARGDDPLAALPGPRSHVELPAAAAPYALHAEPGGAVVAHLRAPYDLTVVELAARPPWHHVAYQDAGLVADGWVEVPAGLAHVGVGGGEPGGGSSGRAGTASTITCPTPRPLRVVQGAQATVIGEIAANVTLRQAGEQPATGAAIRLPWLVPAAGAQLQLTAEELVGCSLGTTSFSDVNEP